MCWLACDGYWPTFSAHSFAGITRVVSNFLHGERRRKKTFLLAVVLPVYRCSKRTGIQLLQQVRRNRVEHVVNRKCYSIHYKLHRGGKKVYREWKFFINRTTLFDGRYFEKTHRHFCATYTMQCKF